MFVPKRPQVAKSKRFARPPKNFVRPVVQKCIDLRVLSFQLKYTVEQIPAVHQKLHLVASVGDQIFRLPRQESSKGIYTWAASRGKENLPMCTFTTGSLRTLSKGPPLVVDVFLTEFEGKVEALKAVRTIRLGAFRLHLGLFQHVEEGLCLDLESTGFEMDVHLPGPLIRPKAPELFLEAAWVQDRGEHRPSKLEALREQAEIAKQKAIVAKAQVKAEEDAKNRLLAQLRAEKDTCSQQLLCERAKRENSEQRAEDVLREYQVAEAKLFRALQQEAMRKAQDEQDAERKRVEEQLARKAMTRTVINDLYRVIDTKEETAKLEMKAKTAIMLARASSSQHRKGEDIEQERRANEALEVERLKKEEMEVQEKKLMMIASQENEFAEKIKKLEEETLKKIQDHIENAPQTAHQGGVTHVHHHHHHHHDQTHHQTIHNHTHVDNHVHHHHTQVPQAKHYHHHHHHSHQHVHHQHHVHTSLQAAHESKLENLVKSSVASKSDIAPPHEHEHDNEDALQKSTIRSTSTSLLRRAESREKDHMAETNAQDATQTGVENALHEMPPWNEPATNLQDYHASIEALQKQKELEQEHATRQARVAELPERKRIAEKRVQLREESPELREAEESGSEF